MKTTSWINTYADEYGNHFSLEKQENYLENRFDIQWNRVYMSLLRDVDGKDGRKWLY